MPPTTVPTMPEANPNKHQKPSVDLQEATSKPTGVAHDNVSKLMTESIFTLQKATEGHRAKSSIYKLYAKAASKVASGMLTEDISKQTMYNTMRPHLAESIPDAEKNILAEIFGDDSNATGVAFLEDQFREANAAKAKNKEQVFVTSTELLDTVTNATPVVPVDVMIEWEEARKTFVEAITRTYSSHMGNQLTQSQLDLIAMGIHIQAKENMEHVFGNVGH